MTQPHIKRAVVYGHPEDDTFETSCKLHAIAYGKVWPEVPWVRSRLQDSGRFSNDATLEGAVKRDVELLVEYETRLMAESLSSSDAATPISA